MTPRSQIHTRPLGGLLLLAAFALAAPTRGQTTATWTFYGPSDCEGEIGGPAGRTLAMCVSPVDNTSVYAGHSSGGLWHSSNSGAAWSAMSKEGPVGSIAYRQKVVSDPNDHDRLFVGTGEWNTSYWNHAPGNGLWYSEDLGTTWVHPLSWGESLDRGVCAIAVSSDRMAVYAGTNAGVYRSTDGGVQWNEGPRLTNCEVSDVVAHPTDPQRALLGVYSTATGAPKGIYKTYNKGVSWWLAFGPSYVSWLPEDDWGRTILAQSPVSPDRIYARVTRKSTEQVALIARTDNGGINWVIVWRMDTNCVGTNCNSTPTTFCCLRGTNGRPAFGAGVYDDGSGTPHEYLLCGGDWMHLSKDGGTTWSLPLGGHNDFHYVEITSAGAWLGNDGGIYYYTPPTPDKPNGTLQRRTVGFNTLQFSSIAIDPTLDTGGLGAMVYGGTQDQGTWAKSGYGSTQSVSTDWDQIGFSDGGAVAASNQCVGGTGTPVDGVLFWNGPHDIYRSCDRGRTPAGCTSQAGWGPTMFDPLAPTSFAWFMMGTTLKRLVPGSPTVPCSAPETVTLVGGGVPLAGKIGGGALVVAENGHRRIYVGTRAGDVYQLEDQGTAANPGPWNAKHITQGVPPWQLDLTISDVAISKVPGQAEVVYVTLAPSQDVGWSTGYGIPGGSVYKYLSGSGSWVATSTGLPAEPFHCILVDPTNFARLYAGGMHGVYRSLNNGGFWTAVSGLPDVMVYDLAMHPGEGAIYAATHGRSIYRSLVSNWLGGGSGSESASTEVHELPVQATLAFDQSTYSLSLNASSNGLGKIVLFDVQGHLVTQVFEGRVTAGQQAIGLQDVKVSGGLYFARLYFNGRQIDAVKVLISR